MKVRIDIIKMKVREYFLIQKIKYSIIILFDILCQ